jgi:hypothetical protein
VGGKSGRFAWARYDEGVPPVSESDDEPASDPPIVVCSHLIACGEINSDPENADSGYSLGQILVHVRPSDQRGFPFSASRIYLFAQLHGTPGEYTIRVRQVRIGVVDGDEVQGEGVEYGPWDISIPGDNYVECFGIPLTGVPFPEAGVYEFQLWVDGVEENPLGRERVEARE